MARKVNKEALFAKAFLQPKVGLRGITDKLARVVGIVGERMAELVPKLEGELCPVRICSSKTYPNSPTLGALKIGLRMIRSMIDIDAGKLSSRAVAPNFAGSRL